MRLRVLGCCGGSVPGHNPSCYLLDGGVAIDAGALAAQLSLEEQREVEHVFLTHSHWDHLRDLPLTTINRTPDNPPLMVHGLPATVNAVRTHLMNEVVWFAAFDLPSPETPYVAATPMAPGESRSLNGYRITAVEMPHTVPAIGFHIDDGDASIVICADTGGGGTLDGLPTDGSPLKAVFIEASFPNEMREFAELTGHLTPEMLLEECAHLAPEVAIYVTHMKPGYEERIKGEIADLPREGVRACHDGEIFVF